MKPAMLRESEGEERGAGRKASISLAYDAGDPSQLEVVVPALSERGLKGTFFLPSMPLLESLHGWVAAQHEGHEMASHTLDGCTDERGNLPNWTLEMVEEDLRMSRRLLVETFPTQSDFAFAYPGDQSGCVSNPYDRKPADYREAVERVFPVARSGIEGINLPSSLQVGKLKSIIASGLDYHDLVALAERTERERGWAILVFRGVGAGEDAVDARDHKLFADFLLGKSASIEVVTVHRHAMRAALPSSVAVDWTLE